MKKHKRVMRILALFLCVITLFTSMRLEMLAKESTQEVTESVTEGDLQEPYPVEDAQDEESKAYILGEVESERTANSKTFYLSDGSYAVATYNEIIHYETEDGSFEQVNNTDSEKEAETIQESGQKEYKKRSGNKEIVFREKGQKDKHKGRQVDLGDVPQVEAETGNHEICMEVEETVISWSYEGLKDGKIIWEEAGDSYEGDEEFLYLSGVVQRGIYSEAFENTDLEYIVSGEGIKENLILKNKDVHNQWVLQMEIGTFEAKKTSEQSISLYKKGTNEAVFVIAAPYMQDANGVISHDVFLEMNQKGSRLTIVITADKEFLADESRAYPVTVDPYFSLTSRENVTISATFLTSGDPDHNMQSPDGSLGELIVGYESFAYQKCRTLLKMDTLPQLPAGSVITSALLYMQKNSFGCVGGTSMTVEVAQATVDWNAKEATWNNYTGKDAGIAVDYYEVTDVTSPDYCEITKLVKGWYEGYIANYGVILTSKGAEENTKGCCVKYTALNEVTQGRVLPTFYIEFRCNEGLESYWTYHNQSVNGGVGYVNDYSGNLTFVVPVGETTGLNMPVDLNLVYNATRSNEAYCGGQKGMICGYGWMMNYAQRLERVETIERYSELADTLMTYGFEYAWMDSDGTYHFFKKQEEGVYLDEDGLGLTLKTEQTFNNVSNLNIIEDKSGNRYIFSADGNLLMIINYLGQFIGFEYKNNLITITDGAGRKIYITYSSNRIANIQSPDGKATFVYSGNLLTRIAYSDQTSIIFKYKTTNINGTSYSLLSEVIGRDGYKLVYNYGTQSNAVQFCRVSGVSEYSKAGTKGNEVRFDYEDVNTTVVTYVKESGNLTETYQFDDWGHTTGVVGVDQSMINIGYNSWDTMQADAPGLSNNHKIVNINSGSAYVNNLLLNNGAENGISGWLQLGSSQATGTHSFTNDSYLGTRAFRVYQMPSNAARWSWGQKVNIEPSTTYTFSAYVKTQGVGTKGNGGATLYVMFYDGQTLLETVDCGKYLTGDNDWTRIYMTFTTPANADAVSVCGGLKDVGGLAIFDCFQLEAGDTANPYNAVENSSFDKASDWTYSFTLQEQEGIKGEEDGQLIISGNPASYKNASQKIKVNKAGVAFFISAMASANAAPNRPTDTDNDGVDEITRFGIAIEYVYVDATSEKYYEYFNADINGEQKISMCVAPKSSNKTKVIDYINVYLIYDKQINTVSFDDIMVTLDKTGTTFAYDENGNMVSSADNASRHETYDINSATNMITSETDRSGTQYVYTYHPTNKRKLISAKETSTNIGFEYTYGTGKNIGNVTKVRMGIVDDMTNHPFIETSVTYTSNGAYVKSETDQAGNTVTYGVNVFTGRITSIQDASGSTTSYTYDSVSKNLTKVSGAGGTVTYTYGSVVEGYPLLAIDTNNTTYRFVYDEFGNIENVVIGDSYDLATYIYGENNGNLHQVIYGNNQLVEYEYDIYDRVIAVKKANSSSSSSRTDVAEYTYNAAGLLARVTDKVNARETEYCYDLSGRMTQYYTTEGNITYAYDNQDRVSEIVTNFDGLTFVSAYSYLSANRPGESVLPIGTIRREYDILQREIAHMIFASPEDGRHLRSEVTFLDRSSNKTTELVRNFSYYVVTDGAGKTTVEGVPSFTYSYDNRGNITKIVETIDGVTYTRIYEYNSSNQLSKEVDEVQGLTIFYYYDGAGNFLKKEIFNGIGKDPDEPITGYALTPGEEADLTEPLTTITYTYGNEAWGDLLTAYNGSSIIYDGAGNPTSYYNGLKFNWTQGRQLSRVYTTRNTVATYQYDTAGIRIAKNVGGVSTRYFMDASGTMQALERGIEKLVFFYDVTGRREGFSYYINDELVGNYYYVYNIQGDVRGILDSNFEAVVLYDYDSWGRPLGITGELAQSIGTLNPFRYRGYIYDEETGLYYLNSRYYDPETGRFLNADAYISTGQGVLGYNMFAYCLNNPVNFVDSYGYDSDSITVLQYSRLFAEGAGGLGICLSVHLLDSVVNEGTPVICYDTESAGGGYMPQKNKNDDDDDDNDYDDKYDDLYDEYSDGGFHKNMSGKGKTPNNNQAQKSQFNAASKGLSYKNKRMLHDMVTGEGLGYHEIKELAEEWFIFVFFVEILKE